MDFNRYNAESAWELLKNKKPDVLVVGANTGKDCSFFVEFGARTVVGLDVIDDIGKDYQHPTVKYVQDSVEAMPFPGETFDLVYCYATMEHVPNIEAAFEEMARVLRRDGHVYCLASPLWRSPMGHHMGEFQDFPWIHLIKTSDEILMIALENKLYPSEERTRAKVSYMLNPTFFNMRAASDYTKACKRLKGLRFFHNEILKEDVNLLKHPNAGKALAMGFSKVDLLGVTHRLVARKRARDDIFSRSSEMLADSISAVKRLLR